MSIKQTTIQASTLLTVICLSAALTITSCGKKDKTTTTTTTESVTPAATAPATGASTAPAATAAPLSAPEKAQLTPVRTALVMANSAVKSGDITKAKAQFTKFSSLYPAVEPVLKAKAGANYAAISSGIEEVKTAMGAATPDKAKAGEGLTAAIKGMTAVIDKK
jgi:iron uptake system EfeUOB component EfeO/EfeM